MGIGKNIRNQRSSGFYLVGFLTDAEQFRNSILLGVKVYTLKDDLRQIIRTKKIQAVLVSPLQTELFRNNSKLQDILIEAGVHIYMASEAKEWKPADDFSQVHLKKISVEDCCRVSRYRSTWMPLARCSKAQR